MFVKKFIGISSPKLPTFAGELTSSEIEPCLVGHYGIPKASTKIAFDSTQGILAVATRDGKIKLFGADGSQIMIESPKPDPCKILQFLENEGILLNVTIANDIEVWNIQNMALGHVYQCKAITAFAVLRGSPFMYIGDTRGDVFVLRLEEGNTRIVRMQYCIPSSITCGFVLKHVEDSSVTCILPQPCYESSRVLVAYKFGLIILWGVKENKIVAMFHGKENYLNKVNQSDKKPHEMDYHGKHTEISSVCWACSKGSRIAVSFADGDIWLLAVPIKSKSQNKSENKDSEYGPSQLILVSKLQVSNEKVEVPHFFLKWNAGGSEWGYLYACGGGTVDSLNSIKVIHLDDSVIKENASNLHWLKLLLPEAIKDMSIVSSLHAKNNFEEETILVLTKAGQIYYFRSKDIEKELHDAKILTTQSQLKPNVLKLAFADFSISVAKLVNTHLPKIRSLCITGHHNGTTNIWDVSSAQLLLLSTIEPRNDVEATARGCTITAIEFCLSSGYLIVGDQLGMVQIFKVLSEKDNAKHQSSSHSQDTGLQSSVHLKKLKAVKVHKGCIKCLSIDGQSTLIAAGGDEGSVAVINANTGTLLFNKCYFQGSVIVSLHFKVLAGSTNVLLFVAASDASVIAIDATSGEALSPFILHPKHQSIAILMDVLDSSVDNESPTDKKNPYLLDDTAHLEEGNRPCNVQSDILLVCAENCIWLYSASALVQGVKKLYLKNKFQKKCCWASTFCSSRYGYAVLLLFATGDIEIRSLPDLLVSKTSTLNQCCLCNLQISKELMNSLSLASNGRFFVVDTEQEHFIISFLKEDRDYRLSSSTIQVFSKEIQSSQVCKEYKKEYPKLYDPALAIGEQKHRKKSLVKSLIGNKGSKTKDYINSDVSEDGPTFGSQELLKIFSICNFPPSSICSEERQLSDQEKELSIDDVDIEEEDVNAISPHGGSSSSHGFAGKLQRKLIDYKKLKGNRKSAVAVKENDDEDGAKLRTVDEIKSSYGQTHSKQEQSIYGHLKGRLMETQIKLQGINDRAGEMESGAKNFKSMAEELLKIVKEKNK